MKSFVLVTGFSPLKIYFYRDGYLTFSQKNYSLNESELDNSCIHISSEKMNLIVNIIAQIKIIFIMKKFI